MVQIDLSHDLNVTLEQRIGFHIAASIWSQFLTDNTIINLHIRSADSLNNNRAVGGAVPIFHEVHYGVFLEYLNLDATSDADNSVLNALQDGNTVDVLVDGQLVDGNTTVLITRAQAKALGMEQALALGNGATWSKDVLENSTALDGYVVVNNSYNWSYDFTRASDAAPDTLDFLTMALHELGHSLGFVSGLDGLMQTFELHSGELRTEGFTALDLLRYSNVSANLNNPDGSVNDLSVGKAAYFSVDGGTTALAEFEEGDDYQASHWQRFQNALGIMDPTLGYQERTDISLLDLQAFDALGWDIDYDAHQIRLDLNNLYEQAIAAISQEFQVGVAAVETAIANGQDWYTLGYGSWWQAFKEQMLELGYGSWWQQFESDMLNLGYGSWWQAFEEQMSELGYGSWWQAFEEQVLALGYGSWWQQFETDMLAKDALELGYGSWWQQFEPQMLELGYGSWWHIFEQQMLALGYGSWWQQFEADLLELGYGSWWQAFENQVLELGYGSWWQVFEDTILELGYGSWWQAFETDVLELGYGSWWQAFELGYGSWWQEVELHLDNIQFVSEETPTTTSEDTSDTFTGGGSDKVLAGQDSQDLLQGSAGDDLIDGKGGNDILLGAAGRDILFGAQGNDFLYGGAGDDFLAGESGADTLLGEAGDDIISGGDDKDLLKGSDGKDFLKGDQGQDILLGGSGDDIVQGGIDNDLVIGGKGNDVLSGEAGDDILYGDAVPTSETSGGNVSNHSFEGAVITPELLGHITRIEAENMVLSGDYTVIDKDTASGGGLVRASNNHNKTYSASHLFTGETGYYDIVVSYYDENDGNAELTVKLGYQDLDSWVLNQDLGSSTVSESNVVRHVIQGVAINQLDTLEIIGLSEGDELARVDYIELIQVEAPVLPGDSTRVEAESMTLSGNYHVDSNGIASGGGLVKAGRDKSYTANYIFSGEAGYYDIVVGYFDENDGNAELNVKLGNQELDSWVFNQDLGSTTVSTNNGASRVVAQGVAINQSDTLEIIGLSDNEEFARFDYVEFIRVEGANDILRGGAGRDQIYGGQGDDVIYGEDELDNSVDSFADNNDTLFGEEGSDTIYGNSGDDLIYGDDSHLADLDYYVYNGKAYLLTDSHLSWDGAQDQAGRLGGNLVTINDASEEAWLHSTFGTSEKLWIGFTDRETEGEWKWVSGESVTYTNWKPGQPNNFFNQDYAVLNTNSAGEWNDESHILTYRRGIIELSPITTAEQNDILVGGSGNDSLYGGFGDDTLNGTDELSAGYLEQDTLTGGLGADTFVLGDANQVYYGTQGNADYATITDFDASVDVVQILGSASSYTQKVRGNNTILYLANTDSTTDLIAIFANTASLDLNGLAFSYV